MHAGGALLGTGTVALGLKQGGNGLGPARRGTSEAASEGRRRHAFLHVDTSVPWRQPPALVFMSSPEDNLGTGDVRSAELPWGRACACGNPGGAGQVPRAGSTGQRPGGRVGARGTAWEVTIVSGPTGERALGTLTSGFASEETRARPAPRIRLPGRRTADCPWETARRVARTPRLDANCAGGLAGRRVPHGQRRRLPSPPSLSGQLAQSLCAPTPSAATGSPEAVPRRVQRPRLGCGLAARPASAHAMAGPSQFSENLHGGGGQPCPDAGAQSTLQGGLGTLSGTAGRAAVASPLPRLHHLTALCAQRCQRERTAASSRIQLSDFRSDDSSGR